MAKKKSKTETGHAKNVANFNVLISRVQGYGTRYNPANVNLKVPNLQAGYTTSNATLAPVNNTKSPLTINIDSRQQGFSDMEKLSTRSVNAFASTQGVTDAQVDDVKTVIRKIRGERKNKIDDAPPPADATAKEEENHISASQQSYDQQVEHFQKLISLLSSVPAYNPNETELKVASLNTTLAQLQALNQAVINTTTPYLTAMQNRNNALYAEGTGLVDIAEAVKKYVKSVKTITLAEFRQISGLKFTRPKKKK